MAEAPSFETTSSRLLGPSPRDTPVTPGRRASIPVEMASNAPVPPHGDDDRDFFKVKRIDFLGAKRAIVCQNENGPCPLLGIVNVLLLRNAVTLQGDPDRPEVSTQELMSLVATRILDNNARTATTGTDVDGASVKGTDFDAMDAEQAEAMRQNQEQNVSDAMAVLPSLATGLDVNVRFRHALDFEFTAELAIFDLLDVTLCHAWVCDADYYPEASSAIGSRGYNQLMERMIELTCAAEDAENFLSEQMNDGSVPGAEGADTAVPRRSSPRRSRSEEELVQRAMQMSLEEGGVKPEVNEEEVVSSIVAELVDRASSSALDQPPIDTSSTQQDNLATVVAEKLALHEFLDSSASQSTRGGLQSALSSIKERELVVFFRNNHFSTAFSLNGVLYNLVTDQGYLGEPDVVWEVLAVGADRGADTAVPPEGSFVNGAFKAFKPHEDPAALGPGTDEDAQMAAALLASVKDTGMGSSSAASSAALPGDFLRPPIGPVASQTAQAAPRSNPTPSRTMEHTDDADYALAMQLQAEYEEEARRAETRRARQRAEAESAREEAVARESERRRRAAAAAKKPKKKSGYSSSDCVVM